MTWYPQNDEVRSSGWSRVPECPDGIESCLLDDGTREEVV